MQEIKKIVGQSKNDHPLKRLFELISFVRRFPQKVIREPNVKPIRRIVGRAR